MKSTEREKWLADMVLAFCNGRSEYDGCAVERCPLDSCAMPDGQRLSREDVLAVAEREGAKGE